MKETFGSLRAYFIIISVLGGIGLFSAYSKIADFQGDIPIETIITMIFSTIFIVLYLVIGLKIKYFINEKRGVIYFVLLLSVSNAIYSFLRSYLLTKRFDGGVFSLITIAIMFYLYYNVRRLSQVNSTDIERK